MCCFSPLSGKLECYGHIYTASLWTCKSSVEKEIEKMVMILQVILEQNEDVRKWSENGRASRGKAIQGPRPTRPTGVWR